MIILVSDTSVLVDLERGGLLEAAFSCGLAMVVPDILYERELENQTGPYLRTLGLGVLSLTPDEVALAQQIRSERRALSPMARSNCSTFGRSNCSRQDGRIMRHRR